MKSDIQPLRLIFKALLLFVLINVGFAIINPPLYKVSAYNTIFPGRVRLPFSDDAGLYSVMVDDLDVMVASHEISAPKKADEFRIVIIGDSSVWGEGSPAQESIAVLWNELGLSCGDKRVRFYNLAYPHPSVIKDLIILDKARETQPDLIVWFITLNTLTAQRQTPFIIANEARAAKILDNYQIPFDVEDSSSPPGIAAFYEKTLVGRRSELARLIRLQVLGLIWAISDADTATSSPASTVHSMDVDSDLKYKGFTSTSELEGQMMLTALQAGHELVAPVPVLLVNEPIFVATGKNSDVRYNEIYPRWAYDYFRDRMASEARRNYWHYLDLWDSISTEFFFDTGWHISPQGDRLLIQKITPALQSIACR
jgi:hypothetical protein